MLTPQDLFVLKDHLRYNRHLHTLSLVNNNIGEVGIVVFVECLKLNNFLQELTISIYTYIYIYRYKYIYM